MGFSIHEKDIVPREDWYHYQPFNEEEWANYPRASEEDLQWFHDAKFGLFLHVGLSAMGKVDLSWPRYTHTFPDINKGWIPDSRYDGWANKMKFPDFDAKKWAEVAKASGFKYVVIIAKHSEGFHMWDTKYSDYKVTNTPFGRDYLAELVAAFREVGLKIGIYFSKREWKHPDYEPIEISNTRPIKERPFFEVIDKSKVGMSPKHLKYKEYLMNATRELMTNYGKIDILWWDSLWFGGMFTADMWNSAELEKQIRALQPHIIINNRASLIGDFDTPECVIGAFQNTRPWETCMCLGKAWSWTGGFPKSRETILSQLVNCVCGDGNYLLSTGCKPSGALGKLDIKRFREIGEWLAKYGESIYATRGGIWSSKEGILSCFKDNIIYLHMLKSYQDKAITLDLKGNKISGYEVLSGGEVELTHDDKTMTVTAHGRHEVDIIVKITCLDKVKN